MQDLRLEIPTEEECDLLDDKLLEHNAACLPFTQEEPYIRIARCVRGADGGVIAGIVAYSVLWRILYIETLWVDLAHRGGGYGRALLGAVERAAADMGCAVAHLDTFDFQGKGFYERCGYAEFGVIEDCPKGHSEHFFMKRLARGDGA